MARAHPASSSRRRRKRLLAFILIFVGVLSQRRVGRGLPDPRPARRRGVRERGAAPAGRARRVLRGRGSIFGVNPILGPDRRDDHGDHQRGARRDGRAPLTIVSNWFFSIVSSIVLAVAAALVTERIDRAAAGAHGPGSAADGRRTTSRRGRPGRGVEAACATRSFAFLGFLALVLVLTLPPGAPLRDPETGDIIGKTPFMDSLLFIITMVVPGGGHRLRLRGGHVHERQRRHRGRDEDLRRARRAGLHAADDQPVHRLLQLQPAAERARGRARGVCSRRPASARCRC